MIIALNPVEPSPIGLRHATGVDLELDLKFVGVSSEFDAPTPSMSLTGYNPQLVLIPRSSNQVHGYDIEVVDEVNGLAHVSVPGIVFNDRRDFTMEVYNRNADGVPIALLARGVLRIEADGYQSMGPLGPATIPTIQGEQGPVGPAGPRGSIWLAGTGDPTITDGVIPGDMYLDNTTGNVWRWDGAAWGMV